MHPDALPTSPYITYNAQYITFNAPNITYNAPNITYNAPNITYNANKSNKITSAGDRTGGLQRVSRALYQVRRTSRMA
jgi:hypothetical protein